MPSIQFRGGDAAAMQALSEQLLHDLQQAGLAESLHVSPPATQPEDTSRGDPISWTTILVTAIGTGGALTALLGKDGALSALARVLEKYVEGRQAEITIQTDENKTIHVKGPVGEIKEILKQVRD